VQARNCLLVLALIAVWLTGCANVAMPQALPSTMDSPLIAVSPLPTEIAPQVITLPDDGRGATALEAYPVAKAEAKRWNAQAVLHQIPLKHAMEQNLGIPADARGWFFMFQEPGSPIEYYVKIVDDRLSGKTEAQPILVQPLPYRLLPIDLETLPVQSEDVLRLWLERDGQEYWTAHPDKQLDYRLVHLDGQSHAVWSLFDAALPEQPALLHVDAVTGDIVKDPFPE